VALLKQQIVGKHVRRLRTENGISLRGLASQTGFSPSFMSQVENGQVSPSISSMERIAEALGVTLGEFFAAAAEGEGGLIVRAVDRQGLTSAWSSAEIEALSMPRPAVRLEPVLITLHPGGRSAKHPYAHSREEFAFVLEGRVTLTLGPDRHRLKKGDAATILPQELRLWVNEFARPARILIVSGRFGSPAQARARR
jgi:transcriptional regulator with XRE-family HTH domain